MDDKPTWNDNKRLMAALWPKWKPSDAEGRILNERWGSLHQDILRTIIEGHRLVRQAVPDLTRIHSEYCERTTHLRPAVGRPPEARFVSVQGPSQAEEEEFQRWAEKTVAEASAEEIQAVRRRFDMALDSPKALACAIDYCREHPRRA
jgi:hypothetical protein